MMYKNPGRAGCPPNLVITQYSVLVLSSKKIVGVVETTSGRARGTHPKEVGREELAGVTPGLSRCEHATSQ